MRIVKITFSPTGGTQKVADILASELGQDIEKVNLLAQGFDGRKIRIGGNDLALVAMPCFAGRCPQVAIERFKDIAGNGAPCVVVNVYGNRAFDDALLEMTDAATQAGFKVVAGVAAIAEHSIFRQFAADRPDQTDRKNLTTTAEKIRELLGSTSTSDPNIPGNRPYMKATSLPLVPQAKHGCTSCSACASSCPVEAIDPITCKADKSRCIACMRCISVCPTDARRINGLVTKAAGILMKKHFVTRKEVELFL